MYVKSVALASEYRRWQAGNMLPSNTLRKAAVVLFCISYFVTQHNCDYTNIGRDV